VRASSLWPSIAGAHLAQFPRGGIIVRVLVVSYGGIANEDFCYCVVVRIFEFRDFNDCGIREPNERQG
jgi:hypothetical protein